MPQAREEKHKVLMPLRFPVKGWAFTDSARLRPKLAYCEPVAAALPAELADDAAAILEPLRDAVAKNGA
jgi:hypothetical protein